MGNTVSSTTPRNASAAIDSYVSELSDVHYERSLGSGHFMKTIRCKHQDGLVVVKIFIKPDAGVSLHEHVKRIQAERQVLSSIPNAFPYQRILETDRAAYMLRQYLYSNLYDRISTRPFLNVVEKKWIAYQILAGLAESHAHGIYHGDIKTENVLVTSWNWAYLTDFSGFKPTYLPEDNPGDFSFFFDTSSRRVCYLAPERFYAPGETLFSDKNGTLNAAMDVFALGCTIAELFLEGSPLFSLSQLLRYRGGEYDPASELARIEDEHIRDMIKHMIQLDPSKRGSAADYLEKWRGKAFPDFFYTFLYPYMVSLEDSGNVISTAPNDDGTTQLVGPSTACDAKIERIYNDFAIIASSLGIRDASGYKNGDMNSPTDSTSDAVHCGYVTNVMSTNLCIPGYPFAWDDATRNLAAGDGCLIFVLIICSAVRNALYASSKLHAIELLLGFGIHLADDYCLDRLVPYFVVLLEDDCAMVRANALRGLTHLLDLVETITPSDANIFPEYILPSLHRFATDPDSFVRAVYAQCIATITETAMRFLELSQLLKNDISIDVDTEGVGEHMSYDQGLRDLQDVIQEEVITLLIDPDPLVKRALLSDMSRLCIIFGRQKANDILLSHMITYLNDTDWQLRGAFFESIIGVGTYIGGRSLEEYILPLMIQALTDAEEFVVEKVLSALTSLAELGLLQKPKLKELSVVILPLLCHPNTWIRLGAIGFVASAARLLPLLDVRCFLYPQLRAYLKMDVFEISENTLLENLKTPVNRLLYDQTLLYASKEKAPGDRNLSPFARLGVGSEERSDSAESSEAEESIHDSSKLLQKLKTLGMTEEDKEKLYALKYYISKSTQSRLRKTAADMKIGQWSHVEQPHGSSEKVALKNIGITPHTLFISPPQDYEQLVASAVPPREMSRRSSISSEGFDYPRGPVEPDTNSTLSPVRNLRQFSHRRGMSDPPGSLGNLRSPPRSKASEGQFSVSPRSAVSELRSESEGKMPRSSSAAALPSSRARTGVSPPGIERPPLQRPVTSGGRPLYLDPSCSSLAARFPPPRSKAGSDVGSADTRSVAADRISVHTLETDPTRGGDATITGRHIRLLLTKKTLELFPPPIPEFGPKISARSLRITKSRNPGSSSHDPPWKLQGIPVAHLVEHTAPINCIRLSADHVFFVTGSDDGTVKVWDTQRLEKNVANKSRLTYTGHTGKVKALTFCENTHCVASASDDGSIHVSRIVVVSGRYAGYYPIRTLQLDQDYAVLLDHYETETLSILAYATAKGKLVGLDLRTMQAKWSFTSPPQEGRVTSMCIDRDRVFLVTGTSRGVFGVWDLRFGVRVKGWGHPAKSAILKLSNWEGRVPFVNEKKESTLVAASVDGRTNEVALWDVERGQCRVAWCVVRPTEGGNVEEEMEKMYGDGLKAIPLPSLNDFLTSESKPETLTLTPPTSSVTSFMQIPSTPHFLTTGTDRKLRLWNTHIAEESFIAVGQEEGTPAPRYSTHHHGDMTFCFEYLPHYRHETDGKKDAKAGKGMTTSLIVNGHRDALLDCCLTGWPYMMVICAGRDGGVWVWK
ncbi:Serine/threonine-protein kinase [Gaertneriomyces sp. JEL0708]|nr:Serine/threonine-protein kinase [Gaertneriomyces sp. JEL0708]